MGSDLNGTLGTTLWFFLLIGTFLSLILGLAMRAVNLILPAGILRGSWMYKYGNYMIYSLLSLLSEFILRLLKFLFMPHGFTYTLSLWNNIVSWKSLVPSVQSEANFGASVVVTARQLRYGFRDEFGNKYKLNSQRDDYVLSPSFSKCSAHIYQICHLKPDMQSFITVILLWTIMKSKTMTPCKKRSM